jgi:hypothetical protein
MKEETFAKMMNSIRERGMAEYPSPFYSRTYQLPAAYPPASVIKHAISDPLGVMLFAVECWRDGIASGLDLETQTASFMVRHKAWKNDFPLYLVTETLSAMLIQTDRLEEPNVDLDSKPPFPAGFFVLPKHLLGMRDTGAYVTMLGYAVLEWADTDDTPIRFPDEMRDGGRRLYITAEMSDGTGYYAKLAIGDSGEVENPKDSPYTEDPHICGREPRGESIKPRFQMADGPAVLDTCANFVLALFTFLNMERDPDTVEGAVMTGKAKAKRHKPAREFWKPAVIGTNLVPTGHATQGSHASPHSHIRRGHWRRVWFGKGREQVKRMWIKPTLVMGRDHETPT